MHKVIHIIKIILKKVEIGKSLKNADFTVKRF